MHIFFKTGGKKSPFSKISRYMWSQFLLKLNKFIVLEVVNQSI